MSGLDTLAQRYGVFSDPSGEAGALARYAQDIPAPQPRPSALDRLAQTWPARLAQSAWSAVTLPRDVLRDPAVARDVLSGARDMSDETFGRATDLASIPMAGATGAPAGAFGSGPVRPGIRAYHGSPHDFQRFDLAKIGTGEGAQAYGRGLYFAENEAVARGYRDALAPGMGDGALRATGLRDADLRSLRQFTQSGADPDIALRDWLGWIGKRETPEIRQAFMREWEGRAPGRMYEVNINTTPERLLDWDAPVSRQSQLRQELGDWASQAVRSDDVGTRELGRRAGAAARSEDLTGDGLYRSFVSMMDGARPELRAKHGDEALFANAGDLAARELRERGIDGIRYLDAGSRSAADGTRNYVVFDDALIDILRKYGLAGLTAGGLGVAASQENSPP